MSHAEPQRSRGSGLLQRFAEQFRAELAGDAEGFAPFVGRRTVS